MNLRSGKTYNYFEKHPTALLIQEEEEEKPKIQWCGRCCSSHEMPPCEFIALPRHEGGHIPSFTEDEHLTRHRIAMSYGEKCFLCKKEEEEEDEEEFWIVIEKLKKEPYYNGNIFESANMQEQLHSEFGYNQSISWGLSNGWIEE